MNKKTLIINDIIVIIISIFLAFLTSKLINKPNYNLIQDTQDENYFLQAYPIGSIYITANPDENTPAKMKELHGGSWESYGDGCVLQSNSSIEPGTIGGNNEVTLQVSNIPVHNHGIPSLSVNGVEEKMGDWIWTSSGANGGIQYITLAQKHYTSVVSEASISLSGQTTLPSVTENVGNGETFSVQNKYITVYMWKRTE